MMKKLLLVLAAFFIVKANAQQLELVEDINQDGSGWSQFASNPYEFTEYDGKLYFSAKAPKTGTELFSYDGTDVELVADILLGADASALNYKSSNPRFLTVANGLLYFVGHNDVDSLSIYSYDGVSAPTIVIDLLLPSNQGGNVFLVEFNNKLLYSLRDISASNYSLWEYDGTGAPSIVPSATSQNAYKCFVEFNNKLYYYNPSNGSQYFEYDGTNPPTAAPNMYGFIVQNDAIVFDNKIHFCVRQGSSSLYGYELYTYDGINAPVLVNDYNPGYAASNPSGFKEFNNKLYFTANNGTDGMELQSYDGTTISQVADINTAGHSWPGSLTVYNNKLHFTATGAAGKEIYEYDGVNAPVIAAEILAGPEGNVGAMTKFQSELIFAGSDATIGEELYKYDGTSISLVANIFYGSNGSSINHITEYKGKIYFRALGNPETGVELWSYDGISATMVADIDTNHYSSGTAASSDPKNLIVFNDILYFKANDGNGIKIWKYDAVNPPTIEPNILDNANSFFEFNNKLYYNGNDGISGNELWEFDGTNSSLVADIETGIGSSYPSDFIVFDNKVIFSASTTATGYEMWEFDGTNAPTLISDIYNGPVGSNAGGFMVHDGNVYFGAQGDTIIGFELWVYDGTNAPSLAVDLLPGIASNGYGHSSYPYYLNIVNDKLVFAAYDTSSNLNFWEYDFVNTPVQLTNYTPQSTFYQFGSSTVIDNELYYWADAGTGFGAELYKYDGTGSPVMFDEVNEGVGKSRDSSPSNLLKYNGAIYLSANDGILGSSYGSELYKIAACAIDVSVTENDATLTANESGATYQWVDCDNGNAPISGETNASFTATQSGNYACIINKDACEETTACKTVVISGIEKVNLESMITVYPNPSSDLLNIKTDIEVYSINIYSVVGKKVQSETNTSFSIKSLNQGIYFLEIQTAEGTMNAQIVKK